jgi:A/G-specific adenine glycosylase
VKRVLARHAAVDGAPDAAATLARLWELAADETPHEQVATYTQAIMDLGATLCTRARPRCGECPIASDCRARIEDRTAVLPAPKRRRAERRLKHAVMLVARRAGQVLLVQRPPSGIWGGLWCLPEFGDRGAAMQFATRELASARLAATPLPDIAHSFTHFDLVITPLIADCRGPARVADGGTLWYDPEQPARVGLPAPIRTLLGNLPERNES